MTVNNTKSDHLLTEKLDQPVSAVADPEKWRQHKINALIELGYPEDLAIKRVDEDGPDVFVKKQVMKSLARGVPLDKAVKRAHKAWKRRCQYVRNEYFQIIGKRLK